MKTLVHNAGAAFLLVLLVVSLSWICSVRACVETLSSESPFERLYLKASKLRKGMSPKEVKDIIGLPSNRSDEPVWLWVSPSVPTQKDEGWKSLANHDHEGGLFLVFHKGKLVLPSFRSLAVCEPGDILIEYGHLKADQISDIYKQTSK